MAVHIGTVSLNRGIVRQNRGDALYQPEISIIYKQIASNAGLVASRLGCKSNGES